MQENVSRTGGNIELLDCPHCGGTGNEPVELENPKCDCIDSHPKPMGCIGYKHQVGVAFEIETQEFTEPTGYLPIKNKFLPLRQKVSGDNSILMVVKL
jgi:hypothetical protein